MKERYRLDAVVGAELLDLELVGQRLAQRVDVVFDDVVLVAQPAKHVARLAGERSGAKRPDARPPRRVRPGPVDGTRVAAGRRVPDDNLSGIVACRELGCRARPEQKQNTYCTITSHIIL